MIKDLDEAATQYAINTPNERICPACAESTAWPIDRQAFLAGAAWQREQHEAEIAKVQVALDQHVEVLRSIASCLSSPTESDGGTALGLALKALHAKQDNPDRCPEALDGEHYFTRPIHTREFFCERCDAHATQEQHDKLEAMLAKQANQETKGI